MIRRNISLIILFSLLVLLIGCPKSTDKEPETIVIPLSSVVSQRLNYRFETDVPAPAQETIVNTDEKRNEAVQKDFDDNRLVEVLDRTITSPNKLRVLAVYRKINDEVREFRLDMYTTEGGLLRKITHEEMAVHFPDTIVWSPDSNNVAFIAVVRDGQNGAIDKEDESKNSDKKSALVVQDPTPAAPNNTNANANVETNTNANTAPVIPETAESAEPQKNVLTFRTEQIYICDSTGGSVKPLTQNEGLMYFYFKWAPNSIGLVALASPFTEWKFRELQMAKTGERFVPAGRPRLVEKNGRERLLDDYPTTVHPVWSPDSAKVAVAFNKQVRMMLFLKDLLKRRFL